MSQSVKLSEYFAKTQGIGVLATTDASGQVNQAIYGRPHFLDEDDENLLVHHEQPAIPRQREA